MASYRKVAEAVPSFYASALKGKRVNDVREWAKKFMAVYLSEQMFPYSKPPIHYVSELMDVTIAVSGSPLEVVEERTELGFNRVYWSILEEKSGVYTGRVIANFIMG